MLLEKHIEKIYFLLSTHKFEQAIKYIVELEHELPEETSFKHLKAFAYLNKNELKNAWNEAEIAISINPEEPQPYYIKSIVCFNKKKLNQAFELINIAIEIEPNEADYFGFLALLNNTKGKHLKAKQAALNGIELDVNHTLCNNMLALSYLKLGDNINSEKIIQKSLEHNPTDYTTHTASGEINLANSNNSEANYNFIQALQHNPNNKTAKIGLRKVIISNYTFLNLFNYLQKWAIKNWGHLVYVIIIGTMTLAAYGLSLSLLFCFLFTIFWLPDLLITISLFYDKIGNKLLSKKEKLAAITNQIGFLTSSGFLVYGISIGLQAYTMAFCIYLSTYNIHFLLADKSTKPVFIILIVLLIAFIFLGLAILFTNTDNPKAIFWWVLFVFALFYEFQAISLKSYKTSFKNV